MDGFPSGQRGQTVNLLQIASVVRIHLHPFVNYIKICWCGGMADAKDLKSFGSNPVPVQVRSPALVLRILHLAV